MKEKMKKHDLIKIVLGMLLFTILLTWVIPNGSYTTGPTFTDGAIERIGLIHIFYGLTYAVQNFSIQILFLIFVGIFYGVVSHIDGYKKLVLRLAKLGEGKEILFSVISSFLIAVLTSILANGYVLLFFIPFMIHVFRKIGFDKISSFVATFGSMLVGLVGATYGTDGVLAFINYLGYGGSEVTIETSLLIRAGILLLAFILFTFFNIKYLKKNLKKNEEKIEDDLFVLEDVKNKKAKVWPIAFMMIFLFVLAVLGFVNWKECFGIELFEDFHTWFMGLAIGEFEVFKNIFGATLTNMGYDLLTPFGSWYLFTYVVVIALVTMVVAFISKMKFNELLTHAGEGIKKLIRPIGLLVLAYTLFVFIYWSPIIPTIINWIGKLSTSFNPFVASLQALAGSIFNSDLGYLGYSLSYLLGSYTGNEGNLIFVIYTTLYGLVSFVTPISMFLLFGLSYLDIPYKKWFKYIWKFVVAMLVVLLVIFALMAYL